MTRSGERNAFEPDPVPVLQRVRDLCGRFPEGPLPAAEVAALRASIETLRPGGRELLPDPRINSREEFEAYKREREAALAELAGWIRSAASCSTADLERLSGRLRDCNATRLRFKSEALDLELPPEQLRTIALHLLHTGVNGTAVMVGLRLMGTVAEPADADLIVTLGMLGGSYGFFALLGLKRLEVPAPHLFALAKRLPRKDRSMFSTNLGALPRADFDALAATLSVGDTITLLRTIDDYQGTPQWIDGNERLAEAVVAAAENPLLMGDGPETPSLMVWLRDEIRYGNCALLGFSPGRREHAISRLGAWLSTPRALQAVKATVERQPWDSQAIWLHHHVLAAERDPSGDCPAGLAIRIAVPPPGSLARTHLLVDGMPLVPRLFGLGRPRTPEVLLHRENGLLATVESREVVLADSACTELGYGELRAKIWRDEVRGRVEWEVWQTHDTRGRRERLVFDAAAYDAEVARAVADFTWEWPARRAARLLGERFHAEPELTTRWGCRLGSVSSWNSKRSALSVHFSYPEAPPPEPDRESLHFNYEVEIPDAATVDDEAVGTAVDRIVAAFREGDPKQFAKVLSGSKELAASLGIPW